MIEIARVLHILGAVLWVGGGVAGALVAATAVARGKELREAVLTDVRAALLYVSAPGLVLAWIGALAMLVPQWSLYSHAGWVHAKLTLGLVLAGVSGVLSGRVRKAASAKREAPAGLFWGLGAGLGLGAFLAIVLVVFRPF